MTRITDFGDLPVFDSNGKTIAAYPAVMIGRRGSAAPDHEVEVVDLTWPVRRELARERKATSPDTVRETLADLDTLLHASAVREYPQVLLQRGGWILEDPPLVQLSERLMSQGTPLGQFAKGRIYRGVTTGLNEAFVIDAAKRENLIEEDSRSAELIKPWLRGKDIKRWNPDCTRLYVIFTRRGIDIEQYPAIRAHLSWWRRDLQPKASSDQPGPGRKPGDYQWYEIQDSVAYYNEFHRAKIVWKKTSFSPAFLFDTSGSYLGNTLHFISGLDAWFAGFMNSSLMEWLMALRINILRGGYLELTPTRIESFRVPAVHTDTQSALQSLVEEIVVHSNHPKQITLIEQEIDNIVFDMYDVPAQDRNLVLAWLRDRREAMGMGAEH